MKKALLIICYYLFLLFILEYTYGQKSQGRPVLTKLPFVFSQDGRTPMESTPIFFNSGLLLVSNCRPGGADAKGRDAYLYLDDLQTGMEVARFGSGHSFVSAFVNGMDEKSLHNPERVECSIHYIHLLTQPLHG
jgi:hypothetical protein